MKINRHLWHYHLFRLVSHESSDIGPITYSLRCMIGAAVMLGSLYAGLQLLLFEQRQVIMHNAVAMPIIEVSSVMLALVVLNKILRGTRPYNWIVSKIPILRPVEFVN